METRCINPDCRNGQPAAFARGVCKPCYSRLRYWVTSGKTTWRKLENRGLILRKTCPARRALDRIKPI